MPVEEAVEQTPAWKRAKLSDGRTADDVEVEVEVEVQEEVEVEVQEEVEVEVSCRWVNVNR
jgi:hypothetical protein